MTERRLIPIATFPAANEMVVVSDDLAKLIASAEAKAAQIAEEAQTKPDTAEEPNRPVLLGRIGGLAGGWF
jgi:hypothetical protein